MAELTVDDLHLRYGETNILNGVSLTLERGHVVSLLGPSGSGKTTLLRAVAGLETPWQGSIRIGDHLVFDGAGKVDVPAERRNLGLVFQSYALWPHKTIFDNVAYGLKLRNVTKSDVAGRVEEALKQLSLGHLAQRFPHQLSGGQQQRVALARALVYNPPVILLDEPLSNLDAKLREEARAWLRELIVRMQLSALCVTHDQAEALAMSDRILLLNNGRIEQQGTPREMYSEPATLFTADFMGSNNRLVGRVDSVDGQRATVAGEGWQLAGVARSGVVPGKEGVALIRVERVRVAADAGPNRIAATVVTSMYVGERFEHVFEVGTLRLRAYGPQALAVGSRHALEMPPADVWVF
ncbi:MAG: ABC transporter ATP-binding protein [Proteobacteria bacterium]|nr:ABC transporter ATP-binding protein [Pseudomonadota bacterium]